MVLEMGNSPVHHRNNFHNLCIDTLTINTTIPMGTFFLIFKKCLSFLYQLFLVCVTNMKDGERLHKVDKANQTNVI